MDESKRIQVRTAEMAGVCKQCKLAKRIHLGVYQNRITLNRVKMGNKASNVCLTGRAAGKPGRKPLSTVFNGIFVLQTKCLCNKVLTSNVMVFGGGLWVVIRFR